MAASTTGVVLITHAQWFVEIAGIPLLHRILLSGDKVGLQTWCLLAWQGAQQVRASQATVAVAEEQLIRRLGFDTFEHKP